VTAYPATVKNELLDEDAPIDIADRCDRCGARATARVTLRTGTLMFCSHHRTQYADRIAELVAVPRSL
jgi:hypothetical protein